MTDRDATTARDETERRHTLKVALLTGAAGIVGILIGAAIQLASTIVSQNADFDEQRRKEDREKRAEVYFAFVEVADKVEYEIFQIGACMHKVRNTDGNLLVDCKAALDGHVQSRRELRRAGLKLFVYGSEEAVKRGYALADEFPELLSLPEDGALAPTIEDTFDVWTLFDESRYMENRSRLLEVICLEVPAEPRDSCGVAG